MRVMLMHAKLIMLVKRTMCLPELESPVADRITIIKIVLRHYGVRI